MFFTRIPAGNIKNYKPEYVNSCSKYLPIIGYFIGAVSGGAFLLFNLILPIPVSILLAMAIQVLLTGAFHEDGFCDVCDGVGGGWGVERILEIMKDSRIGAFGAIGIIFMILLKFVTLSETLIFNIFTSLFLGSIFSRGFTVLFMRYSTYVRADESSKSKPVTKQLGFFDFLVALFFTVIPLFFFDLRIIIAMLISLVAYLIFKKYIEKQLGGYTGDCLGAMQQVTELFFYIGMCINYGNLFN